MGAPFQNSLLQGVVIASTKNIVITRALSNNQWQMAVRKKNFTTNRKVESGRVNATTLG